MRPTLSRSLVVPATLACFAWVVSPCPGAPPGGGEAGRVGFNRDVRPILSDKCFACHGPDQNKRKAGLRLDQRDSALAELGSGNRAVVPGRPDQSELVARIFSSEMRMPPASATKTLSPQEKEILRRWIAEGAEYQAHWSFIPPTRPALPKVNDAAWPRNPIDHFVLARLEKAGLRPAPEVDRVTLIRRVTLDLTGLPPTPAEVDAFLADQSPKAFQKVVDRLLASPRYGERMAVDWLDAARYADTNGYQVDRDREMWPWRDWVIRAFNRNLPFDQFTIEQIAGDLLPNATLEQRVATGLHRNHMLNEEGGVVPEEFLAEYVADRVETTATAWLGLTVGCARCHDHKFDPISQKDFYGLVAYFHNVPESGLGNFGAAPKLSAPPLLKVPTPEQQARLDALAAAVKKAEQRLAATGPELAAEQAAWEKTAAKDRPPAWSVLEPTELKARGGTVLTRQADGSVLASGPNPPTETYTITASGDLPGITFLRLECLPDDRFPGKGPGRAVNGNIVLTDVRLTAGGKPVKFKAASAAFSQENFPIAHAIDANPQTGWALHPEFGKPHSAVFELEQPLAAGSVPLVVTLDFQSPHSQHQLGKFRLWVTNDKTAHEGKQTPPVVAQILAVRPEKRTDAQKAELQAYFRQNVSATVKKLNEEIAKLKKERADLEGRTPTMMVMEEMAKPRDTFLLIRGRYDKKGTKVGPGTPASLPAPTAPMPGNRLGLAKWLVDPSNPLTARVTVNRYWQAYFGVGLVRTAEDFGIQGEWPSHPELLDWLATEFARTGWDVKAMQRFIVTSATYRQSSKVTRQQTERDPENRLLARGPRFRLQAEAIRDQALAVSGLLVERQGGPPVKPYHPPGLYEQVVYTGTYQQGKGADLHRRSLYTYWKRSVPHPAMLTFDAPFRETCAVRRARTSTPLQALSLMNDPTYVEAARFLAQRMMLEGGSGPEQRITHGFRLAVARAPRPQELAILTAGFRDMLDDFRADRAAAEELLKVGEVQASAALQPAELAAYATVATTLLNLDETITKE